ncbi:VOC family protein [Kangiella shandongensis]|uniref:VOC family protein n=1 Tax=Kangiella shandongensis TaxID=2763258 RepID=UPI001CBAB4D1|nr:VOC family protein [Kangiella shandongensis]
MLKIHVTSVPVDDQDKALRFYTQVLGFIKKTDIPMGEHRWLTVVSPDEQNGIELLLEPTAFPPSQTYQQELKDAGIPWTSFQVNDLQSEYKRLAKLDVEFIADPKEIGTVKLATFDDTCGNYIQLIQML